MRRLLACVAAAAVFGCGGDSTGPELFPAVAGSYDITIEFDDFAPSAARGSGTITFQQPTRQDGAMTGNASITLVVGTTTGTVSTVTNAAVDRDGSITFRLGNSTTSTFWGFDGEIRSGGGLSGTHNLTDGVDSFPGTWTATRR